MGKGIQGLDGRKLAPVVSGVVVLLSRLPFLTRSYGYDGDAWNVAAAARRICEEGRYVWSRPPGFPLHEAACALVWKGGPLMLNGMTAIFCAVSAALFCAILQRLGARCIDAVLGSIALVFVPVVFVNSTVTLDYAWGLAFFLLALYGALRGHGGWAGTALGIAVGCRLTWGAMVIPLGIILAMRPKPDSLARQAAPFILCLALTSSAAYLPVVITYGVGSLRFVDEPIGRGLRAWLFAYGTTIGVWGVLGSAGLCIALAGRLAARAGSPVLSTAAKPERRMLCIACASAVLLYAVAFARLPLEFAYLVPLVPMAILLIYLCVPAATCRACMCALVISPFLIHLDLNRERSVRGPLLVDQALKRSQLESIAEVYAHVNRISAESVVLETGPEINRFRAMPPGGHPRFTFRDGVTCVRALTQAQRRRRARESGAVYVLMKEGHLYRGGFLFERDADGEVRLRVERYAAATAPGTEGGRR